MTLRRMDALIARLQEVGIIDSVDLVLLHRLPSRERLPYLQARAQAAVDRAERLERLGRSVEGWT